MYSDTKKIEFEGKTYHIKHVSEWLLDLIYEDTPMLNFIYDELKVNFDLFFEKWDINTI